MANVKINSAYMENCTLQIKDSSGNEVAYTWSDDRLSINTDMVKGQSYAFKVTANTGYVFNSAVSIRLSYNTYQFTLSDDRKSATYYGADMEPFPVNYATITITAQAQEDPNQVNVTEYLEHCTSNISGQTLTKGEPYDIILTADSGYYFKDVPTVNETGRISEFSLSDQSHTAALSAYVPGGDFSVTATAIEETIENTDYNFFNMYSPDDKYLSAFADNSVYNVGDGTITEYDITPYIYALYVLPFKLSALVALKNVPGIDLYKYFYKNEVPSVPYASRIFTIDFGSLTFEREFNSDFDFDCSIRLDIPFFGSLDLNPYDVIGRAVHVVGYVNLLNRTMDVTVSGESGDIIAEQKQQIGYTIPYLSQTYKSTSAYSDEMSNDLTGIQAVETYDFEIKKVSDLTGYVKADFVVPEETDFIGEDWDSIRSILEAGVIYG